MGAIVRAASATSATITAAPLASITTEHWHDDQQQRFLDA